MKNTNTDFISTEIDLDRDVPDYIEGDFDDQEDMPGFEGTVKSLDDLCDLYPDFNAALNGHPEFV